MRGSQGSESSSDGKCSRHCQKLKSRLVKQIKKTFTKDELQVLEIEGVNVNEKIDIIESPVQKPKRERKLTPRELQMNVPMFNSNYEKYEWLMKNGTTNPEDRKWLANYIRSDEYINLYGDENDEENIY